MDSAPADLQLRVEVREAVRRATLDCLHLRTQRQQHLLQEARLPVTAALVPTLALLALPVASPGLRLLLERLPGVRFFSRSVRALSWDHVSQAGELRF